MKRIKSLVYFPVFIAKKYLFSRGEPRFASFLTLVAICGVAIGISALIIVISVMSGFAKDLESKLMGFNPHITVTMPGESADNVIDKIKANIGGIKELDLFATGEAIVQAAGEGELSAMGVKVLGLQSIPARLRKNALFYWGGGVYGEPWWHSLIPPLSQGVILGNEMMYQIGAHPDYNGGVQLVAPFGGIDPMGNPAPVRREYKVAGGFKSGFYEYDVKYVLMSLNESKKLLQSQGRYGIQIMLQSPGEVGKVADELQKFLGPSYEVTGWTAKNKRLFAALKLEKFAMTFLLFLIILIASFSVVGVALMIFFSKRRDLAIMMAMGATKKAIERIFLFHGGLIGVGGAILGALWGLIACFLIRRSNIVLPPSYYLDYLPVSISGSLVFIVTLGGILVSVLAAFYPARRASETDPVELLRYE